MKPTAVGFISLTTVIVLIYSDDNFHNLGAPIDSESIATNMMDDYTNCCHGYISRNNTNKLKTHSSFKTQVCLEAYVINL